MKIFILEDSQNRIAAFRRKLGMHELTIAETATDAIKILGEQHFDVIFLDHDLGGGEMMSCEDKNTGSEVARWMQGHFEYICHIVIHSLNPDGANNMYNMLTGIGLPCQKIPFTQLNREMDNPLFIRES